MLHFLFFDEYCRPGAEENFVISIPGYSDCLTVGMAQISPVWLNREQTLDKIIKHVSLAAQEDCQLVAFGEALLPGYPFWIELTDGARFNSPRIVE